MHPSGSDRFAARCHRRRLFRWRSVLLWGLAWLVAGQAALVVFLEWRHPEFLDPKYGCRMIALRALHKEHADRKLYLILGSSRAEQGFRPGLLSADGSWQSANKPLLYNLARGGSSPLLYLMTLRRLLADGIRPDTLFVEIFPPALAENEGASVIYKSTLRDLPLLCRYPVGMKTWALWFQDRLLLWSKYRSGFVTEVAPRWLAPEARWGDNLWDYQSGEWRVIGSYFSLRERRRLTEDARRRYGTSLRHFRIADAADRALRELLETCRAHGIGVVLFLMPESDEFRRWYPPEAQARLSNYLRTLCHAYETPLLDTRRWIQDSDFSDGHHLLNRGATVFTRRFAGTILSTIPP